MIRCPKCLAAKAPHFLLPGDDNMPMVLGPKGKRIAMCTNGHPVEVSEAEFREIKSRELRP